MPGRRPGASGRRNHSDDLIQISFKPIQPSFRTSRPRYSKLGRPAPRPGTQTRICLRITLCPKIKRSSAP